MSAPNVTPMSLPGLPWIPWIYFYITETRPCSPPDAPTVWLSKVKDDWSKDYAKSFVDFRLVQFVQSHCIAACVWISVKAVNSKMSLTITEAWIRERVQLNHDNLGETISLFNSLVFHLKFTFVAMSYLIGRRVKNLSMTMSIFRLFNVTRLRDHHGSGSDAWLQLQQCWRFAPRPRALQTQEMISGLASLHCCWFTSIHNLQFMQR